MAVIIYDQLTTISVVIYLYIITYINIFFLLPKFLKHILQLDLFRRRICFVAYLIYIITLMLLPLIPYFNIDFGVFNESKILIFLLFIIFNLFFNMLIYFGKSRLTKREHFKTICYISIIFIFSMATVFTATCISFPAVDNKPDWTAFDTNYANNTYNVTVQVDVETSTYHGFFIDSPLSFVIYDGFVRFNKGEVTNNSTIQLKISFMPHAHNKRTGKEIDTLTILNTRPNKNSNNTYDISLPENPWIIGYPYSGSKVLISTLLVDGIEVTKVLEKELVYIEKGHVKVQFDFTRSTYILTIWIIFLAFCPMVDRLLNWYINTHPSKFLDYDKGYD